MRGSEAGLGAALDLGLLSLRCYGVLRRSSAAACAALLVLGMLHTRAAKADVLHVPAQYDTIQQAIDAAASGDEIVIADGVYAGPGFGDCHVRGKVLTIRSTGGAGACTIDFGAPAAGWTVADVPAPGLTLAGLTYRKLASAVRCTSQSVVTIRDCVFRDCLALSGAGVLVDGGSSALVLDTLFESNRANFGAALAAFDSECAAMRCRFIDNDASLSYAGSGGVFGAFGASMQFANCEFCRNSAVSLGGCGSAADADVTLVNCSLTENSSESAYSLFRGSGATFILVNCTISRNHEDGPELGLWFTNTPVYIRSSIVWGNFPNAIEMPKKTVASYCCTGARWPGEGNISADPLFVDPNNGDFRLLPGSPCIDAGDNTALPPDTFDLDGDGNKSEPTPIDLAGFPRQLDDPDTPDTGKGRPPIVDMGAYEFTGCYGDLNGDKQIDQVDLSILLAAYGTCAGQPGYNPAANLFVVGPGANCVDQSDLGLMLQVYGTTCR